MPGKMPYALHPDAGLQNDNLESARCVTSKNIFAQERNDTHRQYEIHWEARKTQIHIGNATQM